MKTITKLWLECCEGLENGIVIGTFKFLIIIFIVGAYKIFRWL